jgi:hypothetical protein
LTSRTIVAEENDALPSEEGIEKDNDRMGKGSIAVQMRMQRARYVLC